MDPGAACTACGAAVGPEEVAQGLAVRVAGRMLCPQCVDRLPGDARVMVNQMRALRGMTATTFRFTSVRHPGLQLFTFTTSALLLAHRRRVVHGEAFEAPPLPPPGSRPRLPSAAEASRGERRGWIAVAVVGAVVVGGLSWLLTSSGTKPGRPEPDENRAGRPAQAQSQGLVQPATPAVQPAPPRYAIRLTDLENRLAASPAEAAEIGRGAELLFDEIPASDVMLRNRAAALIRDAAARQPARPVQPPAPVEAPPQPRQPEAAQIPDEPVRPTAPMALAPTEPVKPATSPEPKPPEVKPPDAKPVVAKPPIDWMPLPGRIKPPVERDPTPEPAKPEAARPDPAPSAGAQVCTPWQVAIRWPERAVPVVPLDTGVPAGNTLIPWPWPSGAPIWAGQLDRRGKQRRVAIELELPPMPATGGIVLAVSPFRADRTALVATWTDGGPSSPPLDITLEGADWQLIAIPLPAASLGLDNGRLRLRLEDARDLTADRPLLIGPATLVNGRAPAIADGSIDLPLIDPGLVPDLGSPAMRELSFRKAFGLLLRGLADRRDPSLAKVILPDVQEDRQQAFRSEFRARLEALMRQGRKNDSGKVADGNPADLAADDPSLADPRAGWPSPAFDDLDRYATVVIGVRDLPWHPDAELAAAALRLTDKLRTAQAKPRRPAVLPVFAIGDIEKAAHDEAAALSARWQPVAYHLVARGIPVIDLRPAMSERHQDDARRAAARLVVDGLRQLDWLARQSR